jgi:dienelactone hydrolase
MVPPEAVVALGQELTEGGADWQIHAYGNVGHGFTNPKAHEIGVEGVFYHEAAARRSWDSLVNFLGEVLA